MIVPEEREDRPANTTFEGVRCVLSPRAPRIEIADPDEVALALAAGETLPIYAGTEERVRR